MKMQNPGNKRFQPYKEGNQVWLEGMNLKTLYPTAKLGPKRYGPFKVVKQLSEAIYQLEMPRQWKIHNVFHANLLRLSIGDTTAMEDTQHVPCKPSYAI
jgi:hypothetical protein